ncbi:hypothetical protein [Streptomyces cyaneofuscatus]|uniref:hypothetical protein n=1 Tax=Streptomyces cyaneofuscatus TaxID=66883 RepID=UPI0036E13855
MALADDIEFYGRAADAGDMTRDKAITALAERHAGGLTILGAADCIANWQTARGAYQEAFRTAARNLDTIYGLDDTTEQ